MRPNNVLESSYQDLFNGCLAIATMALNFMFQAKIAANTILT